MNVTLFPLLVLFVFISYESKGEVVKSDSRKPRARDLGIPFDGTPGKYNAITDVEGVQVGFKTLIQGDSVRTGVTAVFPRGTDLTIR
ncbi:unnamed protein product, partial [Rotaria sordida]